MRYKEYRFYKMVLVIVLAILVGNFVVAGNYVFPLVAFIIACGLMFLLKTKVEEPLSDERVNKIAGNAARITFTISTLVMAIMGMILIALRTKYPKYLLTGYVLSYFVCGTLFLYSFLFKYYNKK